MQQDHQSSLEQLTSKHEQLLNNLSKEKSAAESEYLSIIHDKTEEITNLQQQLSSQRTQFDTHQDTIENLRKEIQEKEIKLSQFDHLLDEQNQLSKSFIRLKKVLNVDANDYDELIEHFVHKMEEYQLLKNQSEDLHNDILKYKSEQTNLRHELQQLEQQLEDNKNELNKTKQELLLNKTKYENEINQLHESIEQITNEKHSIVNQFENLQTQFLDKTNQFDSLKTNFHQTSDEKEEQLLKYQTDFNQQQTLNDNLRRQLNDLNDELKTKTNEILSLQTNLNKFQQNLQIKIDEIQQISQEKTLLNETHLALEEKFNHILSEKAGLENQLDTIRVQMQTTESTMKKKKQDETTKLEQSEKQIKELQVRL